MKWRFEKTTDEDGDDIYMFDYVEIVFMEFAVKKMTGWYYRNGTPDETRLKYVHELQNLYFALRGKELKRKKK